MNEVADPMSTQQSVRKTLGDRSALALILLTLGLSADAATLKDVSFESRQDGTTDIRLVLDEAPSSPKVFATDSPPRIAVDLDGTNNAVAERRINVGSGAANSIAIVEAGGRTRVVVELFRPATHSSRVDGNTITLTIGGDASAAGTAAAAASAEPWTEKAILKSIDFRRGSNGEGRVVVNFNRDGAGSDIRKEGSNKVVVDLYDVSLADDLPLKLDVTDFATLVNTIEAQERAGGARLVINTGGAFHHMAYQTGDQFVVEVAKAQETDEAAERRKAGEPAEYKGTPVTFNFQDIPVRTLLQLIADISEFNIVVADSVQGNITLRMVNTPWDQALAVVLQAKGLDQRREGGVIWVAPTAEIAQREQALEDARIAIEDRQSLVSEYIPINYGKAKEIAELLTEDAKRGQGSGGQQGGGSASSQSGFLSKRGSVTFDDRTNTLLISDIPEKIRDLKALIQILDRPVDQVLIESRIVIANETFGKEIGARFGVSGGYEDHNGNILTTSGNVVATDALINQALLNRQNNRPAFPITVPGSPGTGVFSPDLGNRLNVNLPANIAAPRFGLSLLGADYLLDLELSALQEEGSGEVVANPRVITANQREAVIRQGDEIGYVTITSSGGSIPIPTVAFKEVLLELKVTPTITQDDRIFLNMAVKKDEIAGFVSTSIGDVPQINKRELNTAVLVENGQTVVLGGVYEFKSREDLQKAPFLGDLPLLGNLFKTTSSSAEKAELLIFVTPKILRQRGAEQR